MLNPNGNGSKDGIFKKKINNELHFKEILLVKLMRCTTTTSFLNDKKKVKTTGLITSLRFSQADTKFECTTMDNIVEVCQTAIKHT